MRIGVVCGKAWRHTVGVCAAGVGVDHDGAHRAAWMPDRVNAREYMEYDGAS